MHSGDRAQLAELRARLFFIAERADARCLDRLLKFAERCASEQQQSGVSRVPTKPRDRSASEGSSGQ